MSGTAFWIVNGKVNNDPFNTTGNDNPEALMQRAGAVFVATGRRGTVIRWAMFASNWSSLYYVSESLATLPAPYTFEFFLSGWFSQTISEPYQAVARLQDLVVKSDIHLRQKTYVKEVDHRYYQGVSQLIGDVLTDSRVSPEYSVDCVYDKDTNRFFVERIGEKSSLAKLYGLSPTSYPALTGHSYDAIVSKAYKKAMTSDGAVYDHVMAVFPVEAQLPKWMGYQRAIMPLAFPDNRKGVSVVTDFGNVDINLP
jgi:hypothetical protein